MNKYIVLSADIVAYTSLNDEEKMELEKKLRRLIMELNNQFSIYGRLIKGDYVTSCRKSRRRFSDRFDY